MSSPKSGGQNSEEKISPESGDKPRILSGAAKRALAEAEERRAKADAERAAHPRPREVNGRTGAEPTRYGDWESKGIVSDF